MLITEFYKNRELFITGGTGYLGKSFIEKLLRDCPDVSKIYLLIRAKKNKTPRERLQEFSNDLVFDRLHRERPKAFEKIVPIVGDCSKLALGISPEDLVRLENVSIIIHGAANVRFDNILRSSILMNVRGTHEILKIAVNLKNLIAFIHVSTAYINPFESYIKEQMYDAPVNWRSAIKIAETCEDTMLEALRMKYTDYPNSYTFSKNLSEQVVAEFSDKLPLTILRPSVVAQSIKEPEPGFIDNLKGPMGMMVAVATGISQVSYCRDKLIMAMIPVDTVTIFTIVAAYRRGIETINSKRYGLDIRNLTPGELCNLTLSQFSKTFIKIVSEEPFEQNFWAPSSCMTNNFIVFMLFIFLVNIPLAFIYDALLTLNKREKIVMKLTRTMVSTTNALRIFAETPFDFQNDGMWELVKFIPESEKEKFGDDFIMNRLDIYTILTQLRDGTKKYILKQQIKASPACRRRYKILIILNKSLQLLLFLLIIKFVWNIIN